MMYIYIFWPMYLYIRSDPLIFSDIGIGEWKREREREREREKEEESMRIGKERRSP